MWSFEAYQDRTAFLTEQGVVVSYAELTDICTSIKSVIPRRRFILHVSSNTLGSFVGYVAFLQTKNASVIVESDSFLKNQQSYLEKWNPSYIWAESGLILSSEWRPVFSCYNFSLYANDTADAPCLHNELALVLTTSGSTGNVKFVRQSFENIRCNTASILSYLPLGPGDRTISLLPTHYTYGLSVVNTHLQSGGSILITNKRIVERSFWELVKRYRITNLNGVPFHFTVLMQFKLHKEATHAIRFFTQAGGKLPLHVQNYFAAFYQQTGIPLYIMYGQTEATARIGYLPPQLLDSKAGSAGKAIDGMELMLKNEKGEKIEHAMTTGEIHLKGANIAMGYAYGSSDLSKGYEFGDILNTGDIGYFDADGYLFITGRKFRDVKLYGKRVNLDELEQEIMKQVPDIECKCLATDNVIQLYYTGNMVEENLQKLIGNQTGLHSFTLKVHKISAFNRNASGKIVIQ